MIREIFMGILLDYIINSWRKIDFSVFKEKILSASNYVSKTGIDFWSYLKNKFKRSGNVKMYTIIALLQEGKYDEAEKAFNDMKNEFKGDKK